MKRIDGRLLETVKGSPLRRKLINSHCVHGHPPPQTEEERGSNEAHPGLPF